MFPAAFRLRLGFAREDYHGVAMSILFAASALTACVQKQLAEGAFAQAALRPTTSKR